MTMALRARPLSSIVRGIISRDNGCWLDASDMSTMYQDAAGTIPVTAMEQPVGLWLDKSGNGNHATQSITASRPVISARKNLLTKTEDFADAAWGKLGYGTGVAPIVTNQPTGGPDGAYAARVQLSTGGGTTINDRSELFQATPTIVGIGYAYGLMMRTRDGTTRIVQLSFNGDAVKNVTVTPNWTQFTNALTAAKDTSRNIRICLRGATGTSLDADLDICRPHFEYGPVATRYQRVNTATDYDTAGFPRYLKFDGVDDYLSLPYMGLYANGSASCLTASALLRQTTNACTLSEGNTADADSLYCMTRQLASGGNLDSTIVRDDATVLLDTTGSASALADGVASVRGFVDTGTNLKLHKNSQQLTSDDYPRSGVVTLNNTTIGAKVGTAAALFNNLMLHGLLIAKSALSDADRRKCEAYLGRKAGVQL